MSHSSHPWPAGRLLVLASFVACLWATLLLSRGPTPPGAIQDGRTLELSLEARVRAVVAGIGGGPEPVEAESEGGDDPLRRLLREVSEASEEQRPGRSTLVKLAALAGAAGQMSSAARMAELARETELAELLVRPAEEARTDGAPLLSATKLGEILGRLPLGRWSRSALGSALADRWGDEQCRRFAADERDAALARETVLLAVVGGSGALAALLGIGLIVASFWRLPRWWKTPGSGDACAFGGGPTTAAAVCLFWFLAFVLIGTLLALPASAGLRVPAAVMIAGQSVLAGLAAIALIRNLDAPRGSLRGALGLDRGPGRRGLLWALGANAAALPLVVGATWLGEVLSGPDPAQPALSLLDAEPEPMTFVIVAVTVGVVAPFFEELLFRGYLYRVLRTRWGVWAAAAASGAAFSVAHVSPALLLPLWVLGVLLAFVREGSGGLWAPIVCHGLWNLGSVVRAWYVFGG